jgi:hypothetical protein
MTSVLGLTFDCANAAVLARFGSHALGGRICPGASKDSAVLEVETDAGQLRLAFRKVPEGKFVKNHMNLDQAMDNFDLDGAFCCPSERSGSATPRCPMPGGPPSPTSRATNSI